MEGKIASLMEFKCDDACNGRAEEKAISVPIHALIVEDSEDDAGLLLLELRRNGYDLNSCRVDSATSLREALDSRRWDVVISDFTMPGFSGADALSIVRERGLDVPFIFVSGTLGEDAAVFALKSGAQDYIMKDNLKRLSPTVERELRQARHHRQERRAEQEMILLQAITQHVANAGDVHIALKVALEMFHGITGWAMTQVWIPDSTGTVLECSPVWRCCDKSLEIFRANSINLALSPGEDLPGRVWRSRQPAWIWEVATDPDFRRAAIVGSGPRNAAAVAVPVLAGDEVVAVVEFFTSMLNETDKMSIKFVSAVAAQLGSIIQRKNAEKRLQHLAHYDVLTGLPNRVLFMDRLKQALAEANRHKRSVAVMFLDLDRFKAINDSLGHDVGDLFLKNVAERIVKCVREGDTVSRLAGDEFTLILPGAGRAVDAARLAQKIVDNLAQPFYVKGHELYVSASVGVTIYPFDETDIEGLLRNADMAMYRAKKRGGNAYEFYAAEMIHKARTRLTRERTLRHALDNQELEVHYQPVIALDSEQTYGVEALVRWRRAQNGLVLPGEFIPLAEETGLISSIGEWVLRSACRECRDYRDKDGSTLRLAVNVSPRQLCSAQFFNTVIKILHETDFDPARLDIEITETTLMQNADAIVKLMRELRGAGVRFSVDDFGTGYSSLSYLKNLPVGQIKIDKSFMGGVPANANDSALVIAIITMAHSMGIKVVAEGVETREQLEFLREIRCDAVQGYYFSLPVPHDVMARHLTEGETLPADGVKSIQIEDASPACKKCRMRLLDAGK